MNGIREYWILVNKLVAACNTWLWPQASYFLYTPQYDTVFLSNTHFNSFHLQLGLPNDFSFEFTNQFCIPLLFHLCVLRFLSIILFLHQVSLWETGANILILWNRYSCPWTWLSAMPWWHPPLNYTTCYEDVSVSGSIAPRILNLGSRWRWEVLSSDYTHLWSHYMHYDGTQE